MSDIKLLLQNFAPGGAGDDDQDEDDYSRYYESSMLDQSNPDDLLSPLEKLRKYGTSENIFTRQMVARSIVDTAQSVSTQQECISLLEIISKLSDDSEPSVRCELMEQLPPVCMVIVELNAITDTVSGYILPIIVKYLTDSNNQVRKLSQTALLQLLEQELIGLKDIEMQICPVLLQLTEPDSGDDFRTEAVALMTRLTPLVGADIAERIFLSRFGDLCADPLFHVRKVCASNFGDMSTTMSQEVTENILLPLFARLCEDGIWGVRKACAEAFMSVSGACSRSVKYHKLSPLFVGLLCDKSRWVQMAAYQALGQFIATFLDPKKSGFDVTEVGGLVQCEDFQGFDIDYNNFVDGDISNNTSLDNRNYNSLISNHSNAQSRMQGEGNKSSPSRSLSSELSGMTLDESKQEQPGYNSFEYWRMPIPSLDLNDIPDLISSSTASSETEICMDNETKDNVKMDNDSKDTISKDNVNKDNISKDNVINTDSNEDSKKDVVDLSDGGKSSPEATAEDESAVKIHVEVLQSDDSSSEESKSDSIWTNNFFSSSEEADDGEEEDNTASPQRTAIVEDDTSPIGSSPFMNVTPSSCADSDDDEHNVSSGQQANTTLTFTENFENQKIVPPSLLEHYVSMTEPSKAQTIDGELPRHCAFTLPGVALALGRNNWHCLKDTYETLASDMQWKVRRTLAFSIHDLAKILGEDITVADLVPVFNAFLKDLDEVRIGVLKHLNDFIHLLPSDLQKDYLHIFADFQNPDNFRNWRFRNDLVNQLIELVPLYDGQELGEFICPVALNLAADKVAEVRENAFHLLALISLRLGENSPFYHKFVTSIVTLGVHHQHWVKRKACAQIYLRFLEGKWYDISHFARDFLPSLLNLSADSVANIRLISGKALLVFKETEYFNSLAEGEEMRSIVEKAIESLQADDDRDVRYFAGGKLVDESSVSTIEATESDYIDGNFRQRELRTIQRGIQNYDIQDEMDDDYDGDLVEEVYMSDDIVGDVDGGGEGSVVIEEYYVDTTEETSTGTHVFVEEIIEEIVQHVPTSNVITTGPNSNVPTSNVSDTGSTSDESIIGYTSNEPDTVDSGSDEQEKT